jgi:Domain of unknown function (DUF4747)
LRAKFSREPASGKHLHKYLEKGRSIFGAGTWQRLRKITSPRAVTGRSGIYTGRILIWTEIDLKRPWLDLANEDELDPALKKSISIPENARPNMRAFGYVFVEKPHRVYFEAKNEFGERLGPNVAKSIFSKITSQELLGFDSPEVEVTIVPDVDAVDRV